MDEGLYDMFWAFPLKKGQQPVLAQLGQGNTVQKKGKAGFRAAILYPALLTPEVLSGNSRVQLLLACPEKLQDKEIKAEDVQEAVCRHLKITKGLDPERRYPPWPLHFDARKITVLGRGKLEAGKVYKTVGHRKKKGKKEPWTRQFQGMVDRRAVKLYEGEGLNRVWAVSLPRDFHFYRTKADDPCLSVTTSGTIVPSPDEFSQDRIVHDAVETEGLARRGQYGFKLTDAGDDIDVGVIDEKNPVQSFHPLFCYKDLGAAGIGHMADIHLSSRQQWLARSKARVIEHPQKPCKTVGEMLNICSKCTVSLFKQFAKDDKVHLLVISGDLVDHNRNVCSADRLDNAQPQKIWDLVGLKEKWKPTPGRKDKTGGWHLEDYPENVDFLSLYSLYVKFYGGQLGVSPKPLYAVAGNHDDYEYPFGIYPLLLTSKTKRTNEGIPADHNLTVYEAILAFGPTYHALVKWGNDNPDKFAWFYTVFTPFSDFAVRMPKQCLVGLAWGEGEDLASTGAPGCEQPFGHLPRAKGAVSKAQLEFVEKVAERSKAEERKVILASHFTFVSYVEQTDEDKASGENWHQDTGKHVGRVYLWTYSLADMGTFHKRRDEMYRKLLMGDITKGPPKDPRIYLTLGGHSHRRGLYTLSQYNPTGFSAHLNYINTDFFAFEDVEFSNGELRRKNAKVEEDKRKKDDEKKWGPPWIVVSDSGGSIPRRNKSGEFKGWGSDKPSGTRIVFDDKGEIRGISAVQADIATNDGGKPRFVVALDYQDITTMRRMGKSRVMPSFESDVFVASDDVRDVKFRLRLGKACDDYKVTVTELSIYARDGASVGKWYRACMKKTEGPRARPDGQETCWLIDRIEQIDEYGDNVPVAYRSPGRIGSKLKAFYRSKDRDRVFLSIKFTSGNASLEDLYDFESPWTFEVKFKKKFIGLEKVGRVKHVRRHSFVIERDRDTSRFPDFKRRKRYYDKRQLQQKG